MKSMFNVLMLLVIGFIFIGCSSKLKNDKNIYLISQNNDVKVFCVYGFVFTSREYSNAGMTQILRKDNSPMTCSEIEELNKKENE